jgi:hypothetical protein
MAEGVRHEIQAATTISPLRRGNGNLFRPDRVYLDGTTWAAPWATASADARHLDRTIWGSLNLNLGGNTLSPTMPRATS